MLTILLLFFFILSVASCAADSENVPLLSPFLADGFDFPVGSPDGDGPYQSRDGRSYDSWYVAAKFTENYSLGIHPGEDWNGGGGGDTDLGQPVCATARGIVLFADEAAPPFGNVVILQHHYLENGIVKTVFSQYDHLEKILVQKGQHLQRREQIGTVGKGANGVFPAHLHFEIRKQSIADKPPEYWPSFDGKDAAWIRQNYEHPSAFVRSHRKLLVPGDEKKFILVVKHQYKMFIHEKGKLKDSYEIAISQNPTGHKEREGDNRLPEGEYRICEKLKGPFGKDPWWLEFLGPAWLRISYPNNQDAAAGLQNKLISKKEHDGIVAANRQKKIPPKTTALGGGIGIHGWLASDWQNNANRNLTWGCISMHNDDLIGFYDWVDLQTPIVIWK